MIAPLQIYTHRDSRGDAGYFFPHFRVNTRAYITLCRLIWNIWVLISNVHHVSKA